MTAFRDVLIGGGIGLLIGIPVFLALSYYTLKKYRKEKIAPQKSVRVVEDKGRRDNPWRISD